MNTIDLIFFQFTLLKLFGKTLMSLALVRQKVQNPVNYT